MSENILKISSTVNTPEIFIDYDEKYAKFVGRSIPEDAYDFYFIITQKLKSVSDLTLDVDLEFLNSASLRFITYAITTELNLKMVTWYYLENDEDIKEKGKLIKDIMNKEHPTIIFDVKVK